MMDPKYSSLNQKENLLAIARGWTPKNKLGPPFKRRKKLKVSIAKKIYKKFKIAQKNNQSLNGEGKARQTAYVGNLHALRQK